MRPFVGTALIATATVVAACSGAGGGGNEFPAGTGGAGAAGTGGAVVGGTGGVGGLLADAAPGGNGGGSSDGCSDESRFVYVIDSDNTLYRFDPQVQAPSAFQPIAPMGCHAGEGPNSMAIGRDGFAYVLYGTQDPYSINGYDCAGVFKVDIKTAACAGPSTFQCGSAGFEKFGMGFSTDSAGGTTDALYLSNSLSPQLGRVDLISGQVTALGSLPGAAEFTGNAKGELWGFFPDQSPPKVLQIDKTNGHTITSFSLSALPDLGFGGYAYAFAFWGGSFYIFYDVEDVDTSTNVWKLDVDGSVTKYIANTGLRIVGAGVSTCAPVEPPK